MGSISAGMIGININVANIIGSMFTALGQDIACVHESSLAQLHIELTEDNSAYCTLTLPSLVIGTVGGGTNLPQQRLGVTLFERAGKRMVLTATGLDLLEHVRTMGTAADALGLAATGRSQTVEGIVSVSASEMVAVQDRKSVV